jgi:hypothetical protein
MKRILTFWLLCLALPSAVPQDRGARPADQGTDSLERAFAPGRAVSLNLSGGRYLIRAGLSNDRIRLHWTTQKPGDKGKVHVAAENRDQQVVVTGRGPKDFQLEIDLPDRTDLNIAMHGGDLELRGVEGNKSIRSRSGDLTIDIGESTNFRQIDLSVRVGDIEAPPLNVSKGGFLRSVRWQGSGKYSLSARVQRGTITILGK